MRLFVLIKPQSNSALPIAHVPAVPLMAEHVARAPRFLVGVVNHTAEIERVTREVLAGHPKLLASRALFVSDVVSGTCSSIFLLASISSIYQPEG